MPDLTSIPEFARPWAERCLASAAGVSDEDLGNVGDWLAALAIERPHLVENPGRLVRMTWAQAMEAQQKWHDAIAAKTARLVAEKKGFGGAPEDVETVLDLEGGYRWVRIISPAGLDYEGNAMGHCVGGGNYDEDCTILSLRDANNLPHCTVEWDEETRVVEQVQGRANQEVVERYHGMVRSLVDKLMPSDVRGARKFGHVFIAVNGHPARLMTGTDLHLHDGDRIVGDLTLSFLDSLPYLPDGLQVSGSLYLNNRTELTRLPKGLQVGENLSLRNCTSLTQLPDGMVVGGNLHLHGCTSLSHLPKELKVGGDLYLKECSLLSCLPEGLEVGGSLSLSHCTALTRLPDNLCVGGNLLLGDCTALTHLPEGLLVGGILDLDGCTALTRLPDRLQAGGNIVLPNGLMVVGSNCLRDSRRTPLSDGARAWFAERFPDADAPVASDQVASLCL